MNGPNPSWQKIISGYVESYVEFVSTWGWVIWTLAALSAVGVTAAAYTKGVHPPLTTHSAVVLGVVCIAISTYYASKHIRANFWGREIE